MGSVNPLAVLSYGAIGLGFLLAFLSFLLLSAEQKKEQPRQNIIHAIYSFMLFASLITLMGFTFGQTKKGEQQASMGTEESTTVSNSLFAKTSPTLITPDDQQEFTGYPRQVSLTWKPMSGATSYGVEVQVLTQRSAVLNKRSDAVVPKKDGTGADSEDNFEWVDMDNDGLARAVITHYQVTLPHASWARWRVWAYDADEKTSLMSDYRMFHFAK